MLCVCFFLLGRVGLGWVEKVMFVYSKGICSSRGVQVSRGVENDKMKQLIVLGVLMKTS